MTKKIEYISGDKIGKCIFLRYDSPIKRTDNGGVHYIGLFKCNCGKEFVAVIKEVKRGKCSSCGCLAIELLRKRTLTHGETRNNKATTEYNSWKGIKDRCLNESSKYYKNYGARGIEVCDRWKESFENFLSDMGRSPSKKHSVERIDNDCNYEPSNCIWGTKVEQARNRRTNRVVCINGERKCIIEWCNIRGLKPYAVYQRLYKGWSIEKALSTPIRKKLAVQRTF